VRHNLICLEDRFGSDASLGVLLRLMRAGPAERVLIPGCYLGGEDVQFWLRRGVKKVDGIDVYSLDERWRSIVPELRRHYLADVNFRQGAIERIPFPDGSFDLLGTHAVLEHVRNLEAMASETARVLCSGGWAWHCFGPLYYSFGADHCIAAYGDSAGYDHLLLDDAEYKKRIWDQAFFDRESDPNLPFWARQNQFSFATAGEYVARFRRCFEIVHVVLKLSAKALEYRQKQHGSWARLIQAGVPEQDLLIKSMCVVLRKR
jgi:SAM-dependent methyltransferase